MLVGTKGGWSAFTLTWQHPSCAAKGNAGWRQGVGKALGLET